MKLKIYKHLIIIASIVSALSCNRVNYVELGGYAQGGLYAVKYLPSDTTPPRTQVMHEVDSLLEELEMTFSGYNSASLLSRFNAGDSVQINEMFAELYSLSYDIYLESGGAVDVSCGPVFDLWGFGFKNDSLPSREALDSAASSCGMFRLLSPDELSGKLKPGAVISSFDLLREQGPAPKLNFNAVAQGYSCDVIAAYLHSRGVTDMLVDIGEIYCEGLNPRGTGWTIAIDNPVDGNDTPGADIRGIWSSEGRSCGVVTSGNYRKYYIKDGHKYAHTIDPRTGCPVEHNLLSATVVANSAFRADALATWFMVVGRQAAIGTLSGMDGVEACLISSDGVWTSSGFTLMK